MADSNKIDFLRDGFVKHLEQLAPDMQPLWGKMNPWQMVEHMSDYVRIASGKTPVQVVTEAERLPKMQEFLASEKPFRPNTPNVLMPDTPPAVRNTSYNDALNELHAEIADFFSVYEKEADKRADNPFFGNLDFSQQVQLLHKHATHHLRQFGVTDEAMMS